METAPTLTTDPARFRRSMARFELQRARQLRAEGRPDRAAVALKRAKLWRDPARYMNPA